MAENEELKGKIIEELKKIFDPEIPVNIYDLGFIYNIDIQDKKVHILMTLTVPGCPIYHILIKEIEEKISSIDGIDKVEVELTFEPRWSVENITESGKTKLRAMGYNV